MESTSKRKGDISDESSPAKRVKRACAYGENCFRKNPHHFKEFSHPHLEQILETHPGVGDYDIPDRLNLQKSQIEEQLKILLDHNICQIKANKTDDQKTLEKDSTGNITKENSSVANIEENKSRKVEESSSVGSSGNSSSTNLRANCNVKENISCTNIEENTRALVENTCKTDAKASNSNDSYKNNPDYRPIKSPTRKIEDFITVVRPRGLMAAKHIASAPYHIFFTTISAAPATHSQRDSITFQELLDPSLGELKCSLQLNFMVEVGWLLAQYYFAGYSNKKLTILYGEDMPDIRDVGKRNPNVEAHKVNMSTPFGKHHTKMSILCYEDGSLRVVISTANLYADDWENRTQALWLSPSCPQLPPNSPQSSGESPTGFKRDLIEYLSWYRHPALSFYIDAVKKCDFSSINVFLIASVPGSHAVTNWGMAKVSNLLSKHISSDVNQSWPLIAQASSIGSYGQYPNLWLTGDFLTAFTKTNNKGILPTSNKPRLQIIYPSLENVQQSHDGLLGGGCLPYGGDAHAKQTWLNDYLYQWKAQRSHRNRAMPHIKSYLRLSPDSSRIAYFILTSGNVSKAAWGVFNKGNGNLRIMSYECGVLFLPQFVINSDYFQLNSPGDINVVYDLPPTKYENDMTPWVMDYLR